MANKKIRQNDDIAGGSREKPVPVKSRIGFENPQKSSSSWKKEISSNHRRRRWSPVKSNGIMVPLPETWNVDRSSKEKLRQIIVGGRSEIGHPAVESRKLLNISNRVATL